jgi:transcriptional regulator with GAF, ATPase, and Fis domain/AmiR/NasT family two-component response regulator
MFLKILIVEDQFIESNDLKIILEKAGHRVLGIAKSVEQALDLLEMEKPQIVLLDIFLKGDRTGIDLAKTLTSENIPFIYLTANSNESTFESAKATNPYGFLVKPFREKDILAALEIASYRHKQMAELLRRQEGWLSNLLTNIIQEKGDPDQKLLQFVKAFKPVIYFDYMAIDLKIDQDGPSSVYAFHRLNYEDYEMINGWSFLKKIDGSLPDLNVFRRRFIQQSGVSVVNGNDFYEMTRSDMLSEKLVQQYNLKSCFLIPLYIDKKALASISLFSMQPDTYKTEHIELVEPLNTLITTVLKSIENQKNKQSYGIRSPEQKSGESAVVGAFPEIVGKSPRLLQVLDQVSQVAPFETTVLILGETGVGKEGIAHAIHQKSGRKLKPFIKINCAAIPASLVESELFGHEAGSFTGATDQRMGKFEQAQGGTVFLDEIGEIPLEIQSKLLRVLQEKELERIGGRTTIKIDVRIIAATNRNLYQEVAAGKFRIDLYYRINVFPLKLPPLRERPEDISMLADYFLQKNIHLSAGKIKKFSPEMMQRLIHYAWPGNIRELQHLIERHILITPSDNISSVEFPEETFRTDTKENQEDHFKTIADLDREHILAVLKKCNGKVSGKGGAAEILKIPSTTLTSKMKKLGITWKY